MKLLDLLKNMVGTDCGTDTGTGSVSDTNSVPDKDISHIAIDSRKVKADTLFVAMPGIKGHGIEFVEKAINQGAVAVISDQDIKMYQDRFKDIFFYQVDDIKNALNKMLEVFYNQPSSRVHTVGITGTNGKTTVSYLVESVLKANGHACGLIGTIEYKLGNDCKKSSNTTPSIVDNQQNLSLLEKQNINHCVMEVSSHALHQGRVDLIDFKAAIFTNLTGDHLDYHKDMESYFQSKAILFTQLSEDGVAIVNADDAYANRLIDQVPQKVMTYGLSSKADVYGEIESMHLLRTVINVTTSVGGVKIATSLIGKHNVSNILAAVAYGVSQGFSLDVIAKGIEDCPAIAGRLEPINFGQNFFVFIDYAHTEDGLRNVLESLKVFEDSKITLIFGCGGDRDKSKRSKMAAVAQELADFSIVTTDNCRSEDAQAIIDEVVKGFSQECFITITDRKEAIKYGLTHAHEGDIILITGKGHEDYQILNEGVIEFNEKEIIKEYIDTGAQRHKDTMTQ